MTLVLVFILGGMCGALLMTFLDGRDALEADWLIAEQAQVIAGLEDALQYHRDLP